MGDGIRRNKHNEIGTQIARVSARSNWEKEQVSKFLEQRGASAVREGVEISRVVQTPPGSKLGRDGAISRHFPSYTW